MALAFTVHKSSSNSAETWQCELNCGAGRLLRAGAMTAGSSRCARRQGLASSWLGATSTTSHSLDEALLASESAGVLRDGGCCTPADDRHCVSRLHALRSSVPCHSSSRQGSGRSKFFLASCISLVSIVTVSCWHEAADTLHCQNLLPPHTIAAPLDVDHTAVHLPRSAGHVVESGASCAHGLLPSNPADGDSVSKRSHLMEVT
mmetsp:Transcript_8049/g.18011  ORF Transcript_8049/g.18011 Transcript_8049/m.18011 type:complete len:204 (-) Transcript_8049:1617-2228(-)